MGVSAIRPAPPVCTRYRFCGLGVRLRLEIDTPIRLGSCAAPHASPCAKLARPNNRLSASPGGAGDSLTHADAVRALFALDGSIRRLSDGHRKAMRRSGRGSCSRLQTPLDCLLLGRQRLDCLHAICRKMHANGCMAFCAMPSLQQASLDRQRRARLLWSTQHVQRTPGARAPWCVKTLCWTQGSPSTQGTVMPPTVPCLGPQSF